MKRAIALLILGLFLPTAGMAETALVKTTEGLSKKRDPNGKKHTWSTPNGRKVRIEVDYNGDGVSDSRVDYDDRGYPAASYEDPNCDGIIDKWFIHRYDSHVIRYGYDSNKDGKPDVFEIYEDAKHDKIIHEKDRNFDGNIDSRAYRTESEESKKIRIKPAPGRMPYDRRVHYHTVWEERDDDFDGKIDHYFNEKEPGKSKVGRKMEGKPTKPDRMEASSGAKKIAERRKGANANLIERMNEKYENA